MTVGASEASTDIFENERPRLVGLAYRMLGTIADAEDVAQDAWLRWQTRRPEQVDRPEAWLTTVTTRIALDHLRAAAAAVRRTSARGSPSPWSPTRSRPRPPSWPIRCAWDFSP